VKLPFLGPRDAPDPSPSAVPPGHATIVLLVDDELAQRQLFANALRSRGYYVLQARNGIEALDLAKRAGRLDLVISDVVMPGMKGPELVARLREHFPKVRVLFVSGLASADEVGGGGDAQFLQKPFLRRDLLNRVFEVIGPPRPEAGG